jgi:fatty-acyl-CoA synthase
MKLPLVEELRHRLPAGLQKYVRVAEQAAVGLSVLQKTGFLQALRPSGLAALARAARTGQLKPGIHRLLRLHAYNTPDKIAVVFGGDRYTYAEFDQRICRLAHALAGLGVGPGDTAAVMLHNCNQYLEIQFALQHLRATTVQVGYRLKAPEVAYILENSQAKAFLFGTEFAELAAEAARTAGTLGERALVVVGDAAPAGLSQYENLLEQVGPQEGPPALRGRGSPGLMVYTSGTTGKPKGAVRDLERTGIGPVISFISQIPLAHDDRHLVVCPLYHSAAPGFVLLTFLVGGTVVIEEHFDPEQVLETIEFERITSSVMVPTMYSRLVNLPPETLRSHDTSSLRWLMSAAAPLPTALAGRIEEAFGPILYNFYGATETGFVTLARPGEHTARPGTIGRQIEGVEIRLLDDNGNPVPEGEVGELWVRSSMQVTGYHRNREATEKSQREGFFTVGDLARRDAEGYYYLADRKIDMVISGGVNIYPLEIEQHLHKHPAVLEAAVVGVPDEEWGESLCAFVVTRPGERLTADQVRDYVKQALADYKKPKHVMFIDTLPRNPTGKVLKRELRDRAQKALAAA